MHDKKILHRDIKCENLLMTKNCDIKLGDFGLAKSLGSYTDFVGEIAGTPYYLPPEII